MLIGITFTSKLDKCKPSVFCNTVPVLQKILVMNTYVHFSNLDLFCSRIRKYAFSIHTAILITYLEVLKTWKPEENEPQLLSWKNLYQQFFVIHFDPHRRTQSFDRKTFLNLATSMTNELHFKKIAIAVKTVRTCASIFSSNIFPTRTNIVSPAPVTLQYFELKHQPSHQMYSYRWNFHSSPLLLETLILILVY